LPSQVCCLEIDPAFNFVGCRRLNRLTDELAGFGEFPFEEGRSLDPRSKNMYIVHMNQVRFEWDKRKNSENRRKHGVSFEEAQTVFLDENALRFFDPDHSEDENRFLMLGISFQLRILVVCHRFRADDAILRIISARKANRKETAEYWNWR
jgi:uncharacterized DUF497 family protein